MLLQRLISVLGIKLLSLFKSTTGHLHLLPSGDPRVTGTITDGDITSGQGMLQCSHGRGGRCGGGVRLVSANNPNPRFRNEARIVSGGEPERRK